MSRNFFALGASQHGKAGSGRIVLYGTHNGIIKEFKQLTRVDLEEAESTDKVENG